MSKILKTASFPLLLAFMSINAHSLYKAAIGVISNPIIYLEFAIGIGLYYVARKFIKYFNKNIDFLEIWTHEATHMVVGILFFHRIEKFTATRERGVVFHSGNNSGNIFIALAPYCIPIYSIGFLLFSFLVANDLLWIYNSILGFITAFHVFAIKTQLDSSQPDIQNIGVTTSFIFIWAFLIFFTSIILWSVQSGLGGAFLQWWNNLFFLIKHVS